MQTSRIVSLALGVLATGLLWLLPAQAHAFSPNPKLERDLVALTNVDRTSNSLSAVIENDQLADLARVRTDDMLTRDYFAHEIPPDGNYVFTLMNDREIPYQLAGENLAWNNSPEAGTVQKAEQDFMNSPLHRANILEPSFDSLGVGTEQGNGKTMYTVLFMQTADS